jgi:hypothetical protein
MLLQAQKEPKTADNTPKAPHRDTVYIKDVRIFLNTLARAAKTMEMSGFAVDVRQSVVDMDTVVTVRIGRGQ